MVFTAVQGTGNKLISQRFKAYSYLTQNRYINKSVLHMYGVVLDYYTNDMRSTAKGQGV